MINFVPADRWACGYYRISQVFNALMLSGDYDISLSRPAHYTTQNQNLIYTQRIAKRDLLDALIGFKEQTGIEFIVDFDDMIFKSVNGEGMPEYNHHSEKIDWQSNSESMKNLVHLSQKVTCSTEFLKKCISEYYPSEQVHVIKNMLTYREWNFPRTPAPSERVFMFAGSDSHFHNQKKLLGDFSLPMIKYLNSQKVLCKGTSPFFLKHWFVPPSHLSSYSTDLFRQTRDVRFLVAPLAENDFNRCKSDLKYLEAAAVGRVCLCSSFDGGPYENVHPLQKIPADATEETIRYIVEKAEEHYDEILDYQYQYLQSRWLEINLNQYTDLLGL